MEHRQVMLRLLLPADQDPAEAIEPTVGPLHHPAPGRNCTEVASPEVGVGAALASPGAKDPGLSEISPLKGLSTGLASQSPASQPVFSRLRGDSPGSLAPGEAAAPRPNFLSAPPVTQERPQVLHNAP